MKRPSAIPPHDPDLPGSEVLFDVDALRELLGAGPDSEVRLRYVEHQPGQRALATAAVDGRLAAVSIGRTAPVADGVQVAWYPDDPGLPGLRDGWGPLLAALGVDLGDQAEPQRLTWVPHRRLVVACGDVVVKLHSRRDQTERAVVCSRTVGTVAEVPDVLAVDLDRAAHVQRRVAGETIDREQAIDSVGRACGVLRDLRQLDAAGLVAHTPDDLLTHCRRVLALVRFIAPADAGRCDALLHRLEQRRPHDIRPVAAHGDFNVGQLLVRGDGSFVLVDTDTLCAASPAYDPASYAANLVAGRPGDLDDVERSLAAFREELPDLDRAELDWYVAAMVVRRLDRGLRRYKRDWPARTERLLDAAEVLVDRL